MTNLGTIHGVVLPNCFLPRDGDQQSCGIFFNGCLPSFKQHNTKPTNELMQTSWFQDKFFRKGGDYLLGVGGKEGYNTWTAGNELPLFSLPHYFIALIAAGPGSSWTNEIFHWMSWFHVVTFLQWMVWWCLYLLAAATRAGTLAQRRNLNQREKPLPP